MTFWSRQSLWITVLVLVGHMTAQATWIPIVAKQRRLHIHVAADGKETVKEEVRGLFLRSSSGKELQTEHLVVNGKEQPGGGGLLIDRPKGEAYRLLYATKRAVLRHRLEPQVSPMLKSGEYLRKAKQKSLDERVVNGIACMAFPVRTVDLKSGGRGETTGVAWRSLDYDITVKSESETQAEDGNGTFRLVSEIYDIQVGVEPEPEMLQTPADFDVITDTTKLPMTPHCSACLKNDDVK